MSSSSAFDLRNASSHSVRLGHGLAQSPSTSRQTTAAVQYNHKPASLGLYKTCIRQKSPSRPSASLLLSSQEAKYRYTGRRQSSRSHDYVLVPDASGDGYTLERLDASYSFNLCNADQHAQIQMSDEEEESYAGGVGEADAGNPFDYRNYLGSGTVSSSPRPRQAVDTLRNTPSPRPTSRGMSEARPAKPSVVETKPKAFKKAESRDSAKASRPSPAPASLLLPGGGRAPKASSPMPVNPIELVIDDEDENEDEEEDKAAATPGNLIIEDEPPSHSIPESSIHRQKTPEPEDDPMILDPEPSHAHRPSLGADDDELEKQMLLELKEDFAEEEPSRGVVESDESSEEE